MNSARSTRPLGQRGPIGVAIGLNWLIALLASGAHSKWLASPTMGQEQQDLLASLLIGRQELSDTNHEPMRTAAASSRWIPLNDQSQYGLKPAAQVQPQQHEDILLQQLRAARSLQSVRPTGGPALAPRQSGAERGPVREISLERACDKQVRLLTASSEPAKVERVLEERRAAAVQMTSRPSRLGSSEASRNQTEESGDEEESEDGEEEEEAPRSPEELLSGNESVSHESAIPAPAEVDEDGRLVGSASGVGASDNDEEENPNSESNSEGGSAETPPDELAARREQEAAEASEAEAANRSALAEQQQAQREIILAQAQSEARAIREQQEALLKQQQMQQQILMQRTQSLLDGEGKREPGERVARDRQHQQMSDSRRRQDGAPLHQGQQHRRAQMRAQPSGSSHSRMINPSSHHRHRPVAPSDNQFSDQLESGIVDRGMESAGSSAERQRQQRRENNFDQAQQQHRRSMQEQQSGYRAQLEIRPSSLELSAQTDNDELGGDYSMRQMQHVQMPNATSKANVQPLPAPTQPPTTIGARFNLTTSDLQPAAQHHHYGAHYGSLGGHHKGHGKYYQYAESHKKGQFESGFKRGNKKFSISGHSSQHKSHAEGHVKWHGKKGKGTHYWDYKHKNKKHYGTGHGYGGGHHYF